MVEVSFHLALTVWRGAIMAFVQVRHTFIHFSTSSDVRCYRSWAGVLEHDRLRDVESDADVLEQTCEGTSMLFARLVALRAVV